MERRSNQERVEQGGCTQYHWRKGEKGQRSGIKDLVTFFVDNMLKYVSTKWLRMIS